MRTIVFLVTLLIACPAAVSEESKPSDEAEAKTLSGMSVLGNNEAPKALVLVPWKSSQIGDGIGVVESLSNQPRPVDREVFGRQIDYYHLRTGSPLIGAQAAQDLKADGS